MHAERKSFERFYTDIKPALKCPVNPPFPGCTNILMFVCKEIEFTLWRRSLLTESLLNPVFYLSFNTKGPCFLVSVVYDLSLRQLGACC